MLDTTKRPDKGRKKMEHYYQDVEGWWGEPDVSKYKEMVRKFDSGSHFVEIGSFKGKSTACMGVEIINSGKEIKYDQVDTWLGSTEHRGDPSIIGGTLFDEFNKNTEKVSHVINPIRLASVEASKLYEDESLDFVFIDAAHDLVNVLKDITSWIPKVKKGGVIAGHDYGGGFFGVNGAVDNYFAQIPEAKVESTSDCSWWLVNKNFQIPEYLDFQYVWNKIQ